MAKKSAVNLPCIKFHKNPTNGLVAEDHLQVYGQTDSGWPRSAHKELFLISYILPTHAPYIIKTLYKHIKISQLKSVP